MARQATLEDEIHSVIADGEASKIFLNDIDGIQFGGANKIKHGIKKKNLKNCSKEDAEYSEHINRIMNSPPKKRILNIPKWGGGIPISSPNHHVMNHNSNTFSQPQTTYTKINNGANKSLRISMLN